MHKKLSEQTGLAVYFCDPHSPWQRGSNENMNGLVRVPAQGDRPEHLQPGAARCDSR